MTYVLDTSAILRYIDDETGADRVEEILNRHEAGKDKVVVSAIHWGELAGVIARLHGLQAVDAVLMNLSALGFPIIEATAERAVDSALIKAKWKIPYADAFGVNLAKDSPDHVLVTADFDGRPARSQVKIEFLARKQ